MRIALIGYGKMGRMIEQIALQRGHEIVSIIDVDNQDDFGSEAFRSADVAIEFTAPQAAYGNVMKAFAAGVKVVSGSTGWYAAHADEMERLCREEGKTLFWSSNFSVGVAVFSAVNRYLAHIMDGYPQYDVRMEETHHVHKLDAPSGTAITLAEGIIGQMGRKDRWTRGTLTAPDGTVSGRKECRPDELRAGHTFRHLRQRGGLHHADPRRPQPQGVRPGGRAGRRVHGHARRAAHHGGPFPVPEGLRRA